MAGYVFFACAPGHYKRIHVGHTYHADPEGCIRRSNSEPVEVLDIIRACDADMMCRLCRHLLQSVRRGEVFNMLTADGKFDTSKLAVVKGMIESCNRISRAALPENVVLRSVNQKLYNTWPV